MLRSLAAALLLLVALPLAASSVEQQMKEVERIRGLSFLHDVEVVTLSRAKLPGYLREQLGKSLPYSFDEYMLALTAMGFIERDSPQLQQQLVDLLEQQVLAFYDPLTHIYYALDEPPEAAAASPIPLGDAVAVHELTHALQDQRFHIGVADIATRDDWDASLALHAVVEGEASLVMMAELLAPMGQRLDDIVASDGLLEGLSSASTLMRAADKTTPRYFLDSLAFPYVAGMRFVVTAYRRGGWAAVNRIYDDPPASTREVLHPEEYFSGKRTRNSLSAPPAFRPKGLMSIEHLGEWHWGFLVGPANARGWTGDRVSIVQDAFCNPTVLVETRWESPARAKAFRDAYAAYLESRKVDADFDVQGDTVSVAYGVDYVLMELFMKRQASR